MKKSSSTALASTVTAGLLAFSVIPHASASILDNTYRTNFYSSQYEFKYDNYGRVVNLPNELCINNNKHIELASFVTVNGFGCGC